LSLFKAAHAARLSIALGAIVAVLGAGSVAYAHADPNNVFPGDGAVLSTAPTQVYMDTVEPMVPAPDSDLNVYNASGVKVNTASAVLSASNTSHISVALPAGLPVGTYTVQWKTVSALDGDSANDSWSFTYDPSKPANPGSAIPGAAGPTPTATPTATATASAPTTAGPAPSSTSPAGTGSTSPAAPKAGNSPVQKGDPTWDLWLIAGGAVLIAGSAVVLAIASRKARLHVSS
jgi:methionine-rich copper-binding protein CopC